MNSKAMSLTDSPLYSYNLSPLSNQSSKRSNLEPSGFISLNTHLKNPSLSMKRSPKSRTVAATNNSSAQGTQTFYQVLGISETCALSDIKKAYKKLARKYHPDVSPGDRIEEYTQMFIRVQEAYKTLSDPEARSSYDRNLSPRYTYSPPRYTYSPAHGYSPRFGCVCGGVYYPWTDDKSQWKKRWEAQLAELKRISRENEKKERESWEAK